MTTLAWTPPVISVSTSFVGANADVIETQITEPLESAINGIQGIRSLSSTSRDGQSRITIEFELSVIWKRQLMTSGTKFPERYVGYRRI